MAGPAERTAQQTRQGLMATGNRVRGQGTAAVAGFDARDYLSADALGSLFEQAGRTTFMPQLRGLQARNSARGIRGPLAGATEGDLAASFRRDLMATAGRFAGQAGQMNLSRAGRLAEIGGEDRAQGLSLLGTELELEMARAAEKQRKKSGWGGIIGGAIGGLAGSFIPGVGTGLGAAMGSRLGGSVA